MECDLMEFVNKIFINKTFSNFIWLWGVVSPCDRHPEENLKNLFFEANYAASELKFQQRLLPKLHLSISFNIHYVVHRRNSEQKRTQI